MSSQEQSEPKSFFRRTIDNKSWTAIVGAAFLATIGTQVAQKVIGAGFDYTASFLPVKADVIVIVREKATALPVKGATVRLVDQATQQDLTQLDATNDFGMTSAKMRVPAGVYGIIIEHNFRNSVYRLTQPFEIKGSQQASFDFSETWARPGEGLGPAPAGAAQANFSDGRVPPWLPIAYQELGQSEVPGPESNPRIVEYLKSVFQDQPQLLTDETSWAGTFVEWAITRAGFKGVKSGRNVDWARWGQAIKDPVPGCVVVLLPAAGSIGSGHVGFYVGGDAESVTLLGGNQSDSVRLSRFSKSRVTAYRMTAERW